MLRTQTEYFLFTVNNDFLIISTFFHNFSGYDCHLFFEQLLTESYNPKYDPTILPKSLENYFLIRIGCLRFLDSYRFLPSSLQNLIASLQRFKQTDTEGLKDDLFKHKLTFP